jgi:hypothetical protein
MNAHHIKYTVEFDIPIKIDGFDLNPQCFEIINQLIQYAIKTQRFYYSKPGNLTHSTKAKNIQITHETSINPDLKITNHEETETTK